MTGKKLYLRSRMNDLTDIDSLLKQVKDLTHEQHQVLSIISHDLRSPLNRVFALIQLIQMNETNLTPEQKDYLEKIHLTIADGLAMMRNLVDYRNLEYRTIELHPETFNAGDLIDSCVKGFSNIATRKDIVVTVECEPNLNVTTDKQCLTRVIDNLLGNAVKFSDRGKKITVRADILSIHHLKIEVQDEANGIDKDELSKLFHKFQKLSNLPTAGESSTGLGLFIAKSMAEKIGGKITCKTRAGVGSNFSVELPKTINQLNK
ncbi:MAG TPA: HAMP domain-containing sensor histidine kinase [Cyclobacteriaceae bacterium]|nr:HAMP domain-containing sensor histidine kinase [Cyclobacteriaceae bacterium]